MKTSQFIFSRAALVLAALSALQGCYAVRESAGGGQIEHPTAARRLQPADVLLPDGYQIEQIASGLDFPTGVAIDENGGVYVTESGYSYGEYFGTPRLLRVDPDGELTVITPGTDNGPWNGVDYRDGALYVSEGGELHGGRILRIERDGATTVLVDGLPSMGSHHTNGPVVGKDGYVYFGQGTATNSGVVGVDDYEFGWLKRHPGFHDVPCRDVMLRGTNYVTKNPLKGGEATTGAFSPFGEATRPGQVIPGRVPCSGAVMRVPARGGQIELVAWGFRNPYGLAFAPDGQLYVTENAFDERGSRPVYGSGDHLWRVKPGAFYGWPDFSGGEAVATMRFKPPGKEMIEALLATPPAVEKPVALFGVHSSSNGIDFSRSAAFGYQGQAFVAQFGDMAPKVGKVLAPVGYKIVRVDVTNGNVHDFAVNRGKNAPASMLGTGGLERPQAVRFDPSGNALYVVDFGIMTMSEKGPSPKPKTGAVYRITRRGAP